MLFKIEKQDSFDHRTQIKRACIVIRFTVESMIMQSQRLQQFTFSMLLMVVNESTLKNIRPTELQTLQETRRFST